MKNCGVKILLVVLFTALGVSLIWPKRTIDWTGCCPALYKESAAGYHDACMREFEVGIRSDGCLVVRPRAGSNEWVLVPGALPEK